MFAWFSNRSELALSGMRDVIPHVLFRYDIQEQTAGFNERSGAMSRGVTINATEFERDCHEILNQLASRRLERLVITRNGTPIAVVAQPESTRAGRGGLYGLMKDTVSVPEGFDLTEPVAEDAQISEDGMLHG